MVCKENVQKNFFWKNPARIRTQQRLKPVRLAGWVGTLARRTAWRGGSGNIKERSLASAGKN
jgi:hypothetical protein